MQRIRAVALVHESKVHAAGIPGRLVGFEMRKPVDMIVMSGVKDGLCVIGVVLEIVNRVLERIAVFVLDVYFFTVNFYVWHVYKKINLYKLYYTMVISAEPTRLP